MSGINCPKCHSNEIETDSSRGETCCTKCGSVIMHGASHVVGRHVSDSEFKGLSVSGIIDAGKESRPVTLDRAKKNIRAVATQLRLNSHCVDTAFNFDTISLAQMFGQSVEADSELAEQNWSLQSEMLTSNDDSGFKEVAELIAKDSNYISEKRIAKMLQIVLKYCETNESCEKGAEILEELLSRPFNDVFLIRHLKSICLNENDLIKLFSTLVIMLRKNMAIETVLWLCAIFDAHLIQLVITRNVALISLFFDLSETLEKLCKVNEDVEILRDTINVIVTKSNKTVPHQLTESSDEPYYVQLLLLHK